MRLLLSVLVTVPLALLAGTILLLALFQRHLIYPGAFRSQAAMSPREAPAGTQAVRVETADGERLLGYWRPPAPGCAVVLSFHGNASRPEPAAARFSSDPWRAKGWGVLAIAYRGYPGSTGTPSEAGLIADAEAAYRMVAARAPGAPVLLHGHSLGAAVAVAAGVNIPHLGLYLEAPFDSLAAMTAYRFPYLPTGLFLRDTFRSDERIPTVAGPVLIVHGTQDGVIPLSHARRLAERAGARARLIAIDGDHISILGARDREAQVLFRPGGAPASACAETLAADVQ